MTFSFDPELDGWYIIGGGELSYDGKGLGFDEYTLSLSDVFRIGRPSTHRDGLRPETYQMTVVNQGYSLDFLGQLQTSVAATGSISDSSSLPYWFLPPGVRYPTRGGRMTRITTVNTVASQDGPIPVFTSPVREVHAFDLRPQERRLGDVKVWDRRGYTDGAVLNAVSVTNLVTNPGFEAGVLGWGATSAATVTASKDRPRRGESSGKVATTGTTASEGTLYDVAGFAVSQTYTASVWVYPTQATDLRITLQDGAVTSNGPATSCPANTWTRLTRTVTLSGTASLFRLIVGTSSAQARTFYVDDLTVVTGSTAQDFDGDTPGYGWTGTSHASTSVDVDPRDFTRVHGWDEVTGPDWPTFPGDSLVLSNGVARVLWNVAQGVFVLQEWESAALGWVERGRFAPSTTPAPSGRHFVMNASQVVELTPSSATVRCDLASNTTVHGVANATGRTCDVYITLKRGWTGPKVDTYFEADSSGDWPVRYMLIYPNTAGEVRFGNRTTVYNTSTAGSWNATSLASGGTPATTGPAYYVEPVTAADEAVLFAVLQRDLTFFGSEGTEMYGGTARRGVAVTLPAALDSNLGVLSVRLGTRHSGDPLPTETQVLGQANFHEIKTAQLVVPR
jgi:hypothetical protein